jgi:hypothetical protein
MISDLYQLFIGLLKPLVNLSSPATISNELFVLVVYELTSLARYRTISDIFQVMVPPGLGDQGLSRPRQVIFHPSSLLGPPKAAILVAPGLSQRTTNSVRFWRKFLQDGPTLLLVFKAAALLNRETSFSQVGASSGLIFFRYSCSSDN